MSNYLKYLKEQLDFLSNWRNNLDELIHNLTFENGDIRKDYFRMSYNNVRQYHVEYNSYVISCLLNDGSIKLSEELNSSFGEHLIELKALTKYELDMQKYYNSLNHRAIVMAWSLFELAISTVFNHVCADEKKEKYLNKRYNEIKSKIKDEDKEFVKNKLKTRSPYLISMPLKYGHLFSKLKSYPGNRKRDEEFLVFFGKLRNTIHANFIYFGNDYEYTFGNAHFVFKNEVLVKWIDPWEIDTNLPSVRLYVHLIGRLNEIALNLFQSLTIDDIIAYPDPDAP
ncbi:MAG TPA: hypothetical protein H9825_01085 [Candidatus Sphingobacterium stercorigallinarum]|nr:hypothetical protein [Candidatus Sphingobacterium stercorigallinarum]